jgi:hypothetical protein
MSHDFFPKFLKQFSLQWFCHVISDHLQSGAVLNSHISLLNLVCQKEITDIERTSSLAQTSLTICFQQDSTLVVLIQDVLLDLIALSFHKQLGPQNHSG